MPSNVLGSLLHACSLLGCVMMMVGASSDEGPAAVPCIYLRVSNRQTVFGWASNWMFVGLLEIEIGIFGGCAGSS